MAVPPCQRCAFITTTVPKKPLGQLLIDRRLIGPAELDRALAEQRRERADRPRRLLGEVLVELRHCTNEQVAETLAIAYGLPFVRVTPRLPDPAAECIRPAGSGSKGVGAGSAGNGDDRKQCPGGDAGPS